MKKALTTFVFALLTTASWAVNAYPKPITVTQKDGTRLTVIGYGDEHHHYYTTTDGALLFHQGKRFLHRPHRSRRNVDRNHLSGT